MFAIFTIYKYVLCRLNGIISDFHNLPQDLFKMIDIPNAFRISYTKINWAFHKVDGKKTRKYINAS